MKPTKPQILSCLVGIIISFIALNSLFSQTDDHLRIDWKENILTVSGGLLPSGEMEICYLEAYCRADSQEAHWRDHTVVGHETRLIYQSDDGRKIILRCQVNDGIIVDHEITAGSDEIDFKIAARNPTAKRSETHWAQPCIRVGEFTGAGPDKTDDKYAYVSKSFVFLDGELARMPTRDWATEARYTPGQVWAAPGVNRADVNPRPLHPDTPSNGLIGCFNADESMIFAVAFEPYQELFQGVIRCLHSDFRLGGLEPGESLDIKVKIYFLPNNIPALLERYHQDFPEHRTSH